LDPNDSIAEPDPSGGSNADPDPNPDKVSKGKIGTGTLQKNNRCQNFLYLNCVAPLWHYGEWVGEQVAVSAVVESVQSPPGLDRPHQL
jgi:hypothetical protein